MKCQFVKKYAYQIFSSLCMLLVAVGVQAAVQEAPDRHTGNLRWKINEEPILLSWPEQTREWLREHCLPDEIFGKVSLLFKNPQAIELLSELYKELSPAVHAEIAHKLQRHGFIFLEKHYVQSHTMFKHKNFPGYIFHMARLETEQIGQKTVGYRDEIRNLQRITYSSSMQQHLNKINETRMRSLQQRLTIDLPQQWVYLLPYGDRVTYRFCPKTMVVRREHISEHEGLAQQLAMWTKRLICRKQAYPQKDNRYTPEKNWLLRSIGYASNDYYHAAGALALVDTEPTKEQSASQEFRIPGLPLTSRTFCTGQTANNDPCYIMLGQYGALATAPRVEEQVTGLDAQKGQPVTSSDRPSTIPIRKSSGESTDHQVAHRHDVIATDRIIPSSDTSSTNVRSGRKSTTQLVPQSLSHHRTESNRTIPSSTPPPNSLITPEAEEYRKQLITSRGDRECNQRDMEALDALREFPTSSPAIDEIMVRLHRLTLDDERALSEKQKGLLSGLQKQYPYRYEQAYIRAYEMAHVDMLPED